MKRITSLLVCLLLFGFTAINAQDIQIKGKVTSSDDGSPLPGVSVVVKGTTQGTATDVNGNFELTAPSDATLVVSSVGYQPQELAVAGQTMIDVALGVDVLKVDEVVVTAIGIQREVKSLGYSVTEVGEESLNKSKTTDVLNSLTGKVAGVSITSSAGTAGASTYITIRGGASITGNNQPLFIVDGIPVMSGGGGYGVDGVATSKRTIDFNPEDIESMSVLKGGAATALYGLQAANGAIVITTKKGKASGGKVRVDFASSVTMSKINKTLELQDKFSQGSGGVWAQGSSLSWGAKMDTLYYYRPPAWSDAPYLWNPDGYIVGKNQKFMADGKTPVDPAYITNEKVKTYDPYDFFQTGIAYNNSISLAGGNDNTTYYVSYANLTEEGIVPNNTFSKNSFKATFDAKLNRKLSTGASVNYINSGGNRIQQGSNISGVMLGLVRTSPTFNNAAGYKFEDGKQRNYRGNGTSSGAYDNPYWTANENAYEDNVNRLIAQWNMNYNITSWASLTYRLGTDYFTEEVKDYFAVNSRANPTGKDYEYTGYEQNINSDLLLNLRKDFGSDIKGNLTLGHNIFQYKGRYVDALASGLSIPEFYQIDNTASQSANSGITQYRTAALFANLGLQYKEMIFLDATGRNDWSTTMPEDNLSEFYPSVGGSFVFTEIPGLKDNSILPFGKLRASWAKVANIAGAYNTLSYYASTYVGDGWTQDGGIYFPFMGYSGYTVDFQLGNANLKHETQTSFEVGVDLRFLNNRLGLDFTYFNKKNTDLLLSVPIAATSGYTALYQNAASKETNGVEIVLNLVPVQTKAFKWDLSANFYKFEDIVTKLAPGVDNVFLGGFVDPQIRAVVDEHYPTIFGFDYWKDSNGNVVINDDPADDYPDGYPMGNYVMVPLGKVNPDWVMGINNVFTLFNTLTITALLEIKQGGLMWNGTMGALEYFGTAFNTADRDVPYVFDGVKGHLGVDAEGNEIVITDGTKNDVEVLQDQAWRSGDGSGFTGITRPVEETSWTRLRELTIAYALPTSLIGSTFLKNVEVYFTGRNLFLDTPYSGIDPETNLLGSDNAQGMDYFNMPGTKSYSFGLRVGF